MEFNEYFVSNKDGKSNCVIRSFCKIYNEDYDTVFNELCDIAKELNCDSFNDVEVFEYYMKKRDTESIDYGKDQKIRDLDLGNGEFLTFCWNKNDFYHMVPIINDTLYDKNDKSLNLFAIKVYKKKK